MIFDIHELKKLPNETPFFVFSKEVLLNNLTEYRNYLPHPIEICYAMKANSEEIVLQNLFSNDVGFEVASKYELALLKAIRVPPGRIVYGTSVKPESHIKEFVQYGVNRFAFDSEQELLKIASIAPRSYVYVRMLVDDRSDSIFTMSKKFGATPEETLTLLLKAREMGLVPYGISFNVGSQARNGEAWARGVRDVIEVMEKLLRLGIKVQVINLGGGFPYNYQNNDDFPRLGEIAQHIHKVVEKMPYSISYIAEPGRGLVANAFVLITSVIGKRKRSNGHWLYLDAGIYNALLEAATWQGKTRYHVEPLSITHQLRDKKESFILTGPTGDNLDVISEGQLLPADIDVGDKLIIRDVGAYTFPFVTSFNGFPKPKIIT